MIRSPSSACDDKGENRSSADRVRHTNDITQTTKSATDLREIYSIIMTAFLQDNQPREPYRWHGKQDPHIPPNDGFGFLAFLWRDLAPCETLEQKKMHFCPY